MNESAELIINIETKDADGFPLKARESFPVFAKIGSVKRQEYYAAMKSDVKVDLMATINSDDWNNAFVIDSKTGKKLRPTHFLFDGIEYNIFRSYEVSEAVTELTLQEI